MKSLTTIQKTFRVFQILTKIAMVFSFVGAGLAAVAIACGMVWQNGGTVIGADMNMLFDLTETSELREMIGVLAVDMVILIMDGIILAHALHYFKVEQADGTPFTYHGSVLIRKQGIRTIVLQLVAGSVAAALGVIYELPRSFDNWDSAWGVTMGVGMILLSLIFKYGADLEEKVK